MLTIIAWIVVCCFMVWEIIAFLFGASAPWLSSGNGFAPMNPFVAVALTPVLGAFNAIACAILVIPTWIVVIPAFQYILRG